MVYEILKETINATSQTPNVLRDSVLVVFKRITELLFAPSSNPEMFWIIAPMIIATLFMTFYFGRYEDEKLGWNTAFGNSMIFLFVVLDIFRKIFESTDPPSLNNFINDPFYVTLSASLIILGLVMMLFNFYRLWSEKIAFFFSSPLPINVTIYVVLTIVYTQVPADFLTFVAGIGLFAIFFLFLELLQDFQRLPRKIRWAINEKNNQK
ncbi:MAG: hypothetical protein QW331_02710 [Candidatus Woesearchaeota archaeon]